MPKHADDDPVIFRYGSSRNITFRGKGEVGYTWGEWREMSDAEQDEAIDEALSELVDIYIEDEKDESR